MYRDTLTAGDVAVALAEVTVAEPAIPARWLRDTGGDLDAAVLEEGREVDLVGTGGGAAAIDVPLVDFDPASEAEPCQGKRREGEGGKAGRREEGREERGRERERKE